MATFLVRTTALPYPAEREQTTEQQRSDGFVVTIAYQRSIP